ncbi:hypothetical protein A3860_38040 [Niastella vici]|uniref:DUF4276 family protein n=1 Tax=Niastella vici TaxID=1703345 RepID=A0A1V9FLP2_9BACT|nr:DUF4276 family protein [Niastella vici]OQP59258.1 hypothetical protein A3860_38040 [Niastella vici]
MSNILTIGYTTEGTTDQRFLKTIILKVFEELAFYCEGDIEVFEPIFIEFPKENGFINDVLEVALKASTAGINVLCIHVDADNSKDEDVNKFKFTPANAALLNKEEKKYCKNIVPIIPIHMTEAWMLADKDLLKEEMCTNKSNVDLKINRDPESIADPKKTIEDALVIAQAHLPRRRFRIEIGDLYQPIGQKIPIPKLENLDSFKKFKHSAIEALKKLNYLH